MLMTDQPLSAQSKACRHAWRPYADAARIWQVCDKCGLEEHVTTHEDALMQNLAYIFKDVER